jgi:4-hydroxyphenylpyruvate dioxygenase-like putative hemolysin
MDILHFDHVSMAVPELEPQLELLESLFGFKRDWEAPITQGDFRYMSMDIPGSEVGWEVMAPHGDEANLLRFLAGSGPGLHHLTMQVPDAEAAATQLEGFGIEPWGVPLDRQTWPWRETYIHPRRGGHGSLFQFYSLPDGGSWHSHDPGRWDDDGGDHTLGITTFLYVAHAHEDATMLGEWYERILGMQPAPTSTLPALESARAVGLAAPTRQVLWQAIEPNGAGSLRTFLDERGPGLHHVAFEVADWERVIAACAHHGIQLSAERAGESQGAGWKDAFIGPEGTGGIPARLVWREEAAG